MDITTHEAHLREILKARSSSARLAFTAACAERLMAAFAPAVPEARRQDIESAINVAWEIVSGKRVESTVLPVLLEALSEAMVPDDSTAGDEDALRLGDALAVTVYLLQEAQQETGDNAFWAARLSLDAWDRVARSSIPSGLVDAPSAVRPPTDPRVKEEISEQRNDLASCVLASTSRQGTDAMRERARMTGYLMGRLP